MVLVIVIRVHAMSKKTLNKANLEKLGADMRRGIWRNARVPTRQSASMATILRMTSLSKPCARSMGGNTGSGGLSMGRGGLIGSTR